MSSYLTIYLKLKQNDQIIKLFDFSRNTEIYQYFIDTIHPAWSESKYTKLNDEMLNDVLNDIHRDITTTQTRISELRLCANGNINIINEILELKELVKSLEYCQTQIYMIKELISHTLYMNDPDYIEVLCNVG
jgi:hypothetical protein